MLEKWSIVWCKGAAGSRVKHGVMPACSGLCSFGTWGPQKRAGAYTATRQLPLLTYPRNFIIIVQKILLQGKIVGNSKSFFSSPQYYLSVLIRLDLLLIGKKENTTRSIICSHIFVYAVPSPALPMMVNWNVLILHTWWYGVLLLLLFLWCKMAYKSIKLSCSFARRTCAKSMGSLFC